ncbi:MAG: hypothetical protein V1717_03215, partial [Candidatus Micrarchaeota archaeon]
FYKKVGRLELGKYTQGQSKEDSEMAMQLVRGLYGQETDVQSVSGGDYYDDPTGVECKKNLQAAYNFVDTLTWVGVGLSGGAIPVAILIPGGQAAALRMASAGIPLATIPAKTALACNQAKSELPTCKATNFCVHLSMSVGVESIVNSIAGGIVPFGVKGLPWTGRVPLKAASRGLAYSLAQTGLDAGSFWFWYSISDQTTPHPFMVYVGGKAISSVLGSALRYGLAKKAFDGTTVAASRLGGLARQAKDVVALTPEKWPEFITKTSLKGGKVVFKEGGKTVVATIDDVVKEPIFIATSAVSKPTGLEEVLEQSERVLPGLLKITRAKPPGAGQKALSETLDVGKADLVSLTPGKASAGVVAATAATGAGAGWTFLKSIFSVSPGLLLSIPASALLHVNGNPVEAKLTDEVTNYALVFNHASSVPSLAAYCYYSGSSADSCAERISLRESCGEGESCLSFETFRHSPSSPQEKAGITSFLMAFSYDDAGYAWEPVFVSIFQPDSQPLGLESIDGLVLKEKIGSEEQKLSQSEIDAESKKIDLENAQAKLDDFKNTIESGALPSSVASEGSSLIESMRAQGIVDSGGKVVEGKASEVEKLIDDFKSRTAESQSIG